MEKKWSKQWIASKQPRKQRKYLANLPLHRIKNVMHSMLSKELKTQIKKNSVPIRKGDKIKIMRGQFKNKIGKIDKVLYKKKRVFVDIAKITKKDGSSTFYPIHPSNVQILEITSEDKKRKKSFERGKK